MVATVLLAAGVTGCSRTAEEPGGQSPTPRARDDDGVRTMSVEGRDVTFSATTGSLPESWPEEIPVHPDATVQGAETVAFADSNALAYRLELRLSEAFDAVVAWHAASLPGAGWTIDDESVAGNEGGRNAVFSASRADGALSVAVSEFDDATHVYIEAGLQAEVAE